MGSKSIHQVWVLIRFVLLSLCVPGCSAFGQVPAEPVVVVVGGGVAGLTAAYELEGVDVILLEKESRVGGRAFSGDYEGVPYTLGTEYLGEPEGTLAEIIEELDLEPVEIASPMDVRYHAGNMYYGEDGIALMLINESSVVEYNRFVDELQELVDDYDDVPWLELTSELSTFDQMTAADWFEDEGFSAIYTEYYNVTSRGLFGASLDEISALSFISEAGFDYLGVDPIGSIDELDNVPEQDVSTEAYTFVTGITEVTDALAADLGASIRTNANVESVVESGDGYLVTYTDAGGGRVELACNSVILAVPAQVALQIAPTILAEEQKDILGQIPYSQYITVALVTDRPVFEDGFDLAVDDGLFFTDVYDSTWILRHEDPSRVPDGVHIISVFVAPDSYEDQSLTGMTDEAILSEIYDDLAIVVDFDPSWVVETDIHRIRYAYPVMTTRAYDRITRLHEITSGRVGLAGDYMSYPTFEAAVETGWLAAKQVMESFD